jgi:hypothetical protein
MHECLPQRTTESFVCSERSIIPGYGISGSIQFVQLVRDGPFLVRDRSAA